MKATNGSIKPASATSPQEKRAAENSTVLPGESLPSPEVGEDAGQETLPESNKVYDEDGERNDTMSGRDDGPAESKKGRLVKKIERFNKFIDKTVVGLDPFTALLWLVLYRMERNGIATATHGRVAQLMGVSKRTVARHIKVLIANKLLRQVGRGGWGHGYNKYRFGLKPLTKDNPLKAYKPKSGPEPKSAEEKSAKPAGKKPAPSELLRRKPK